MPESVPRPERGIVALIRGIEDGTRLPEGTCRRCRGMGIVYVGDGFGGREGVRCPECKGETNV